MTEFKNILIATDGSEYSDNAIKSGFKMANNYQSKVHILHVYDPRTVSMEEGLSIEKEDFVAVHLDGFKSMVEGKKMCEIAEVDCTDTVIPSLDPATEIVKYARDNAIDLIVIGTLGKTGVSRFLIGSVAEKVVRRAPCSVHIAKPVIEGKEKIKEADEVVIPRDEQILVDVLKDVLKKSSPVKTRIDMGKREDVKKEAIETSEILHTTGPPPVSLEIRLKRISDMIGADVEKVAPYRDLESLIASLNLQSADIGISIPKRIQIEGEEIELRDLIWRINHFDYLTSETAETLRKLASYLYGEIERIKNEISSLESLEKDWEKAKALTKEAKGLIRSINFIKRIEKRTRLESTS